jgi:hypothetical protein
MAWSAPMGVAKACTWSCLTVFSDIL